MKRHPSRFITKYYTVKEWKRFSPNIQAEISRRYSVILTDHKTNRERVHAFTGNIKKSLANKEKAKGFGGKILQGISNMGVEPSPSRVKKKYVGVNYLDSSIHIQSPNSLGVFSSKKSKGNDFSHLATFK